MTEVEVNGCWPFVGVRHEGNSVYSVVSKVSE